MTGKTLLGVCHNVAAKKAELRSIHRGAKLLKVWWVADEQGASRILKKLPIGAAAVADQFAAVAAVEGIPFATDEEVSARALENIGEMRRRCAGELRALNADYRQWRLKRAAEGLKSIPYDRFIERQEIRLIYSKALG